MDLGKLASLSVGLAAFIGGLWMVLQIVRSVRRNGKDNHSGQQSTAFWQTEMRSAVKEVLFETAARRHVELAKVVREVFEQEFLRRDEKLRETIRREIREALRERRDNE